MYLDTRVSRNHRTSALPDFQGHAGSESKFTRGSARRPLNYASPKPNLERTVCPHGFTTHPRTTSGGKRMPPRPRASWERSRYEPDLGRLLRSQNVFILYDHILHRRHQSQQRVTRPQSNLLFTTHSNGQGANIRRNFPIPTAVPTTPILFVYQCSDPALASGEISVSPEPSLGNLHQQRKA